VCEPEAKLVDKLLGDVLKTSMGQVKLPGYILQYTAMGYGDGQQRVWKLLHTGALPVWGTIEVKTSQFGTTKCARELFVLLIT
jgi:hypothetical protein